jgi:hypothetical protein
MGMGFIVKNPSKRSESLKNGLEEKKVKFNVKKLILRKVISNTEVYKVRRR